MIDIQKIKKCLGRFCLCLCQHISWSCLFSFVMVLIIGGILFFIYVISAPKAGVGDVSFFRIEEEAYQEVLKYWQEREKALEQIDFKKYLDPFRGIIEPEEKPE